jgi:serine/threonine protein kinase
MGKRYGDWEVVRNVAEGGQALTFLVRHKSGNEAVLKRLKNPKRKWRFDREIEALLQLSSPAIPRLLDFGETNGTAWLVTDLCGNPLLRVIQEVSLTVRLRWFRDAALAVRDAHLAGIAHRDIKPDNLVISPDFARAFLVDFGICALSDPGPPYTTVEAFGNAAFAAPECFLGHPGDAGESADVYSLGKTLYWIASGGRAIFREVTRDLEGTLMVGPVGVQERILSIVRACVREEPIQRISSEEILKRAESLLEYAEVLAREESQGLFRLTDGVGKDERFDLSWRFVGTEQLQATKVRNDLGRLVRVRRISIAASPLSAMSRIEILLLQNPPGIPDNHTLGSIVLSLKSGPREVHSVDCDIPVPSGDFWMVFRSADAALSDAAIYTAADEVAPRKEILAESFDSGATWEFKESPAGPGLALRIEATG